MKKKHLPTQKRCRSFILIEVLVAFALVALCLFPLLKPHFIKKQVDLAQIEKIQLHREAQNAFILLKQKLYEKEIASFEQLQEGVSGRLDRPFTLYFPHRETRSYICEYTIKKVRDFNKKTAKTDYLLLKSKLYFFPNNKPNPTKRDPYTYYVLVARKRG